MLWNRFLLICMLLPVGLIYAQEQSIRGQLVDQSTNVPLKSITILLKSSEHKIIAFKSSDAEGNFHFVTTKDLTGAYLEVNHLGYKKKRVESLSSNSKLIIELAVNTVLLEDIEIKSRPKVQRVGDTLSYHVGSFAKEEDRSIGDVLKRMPGIEVSESGQIKYQGKSISNFYIDGDDLLGDGYALGTKTVGHKMVQDIQVLNNHEHMKVLKNKRYTENVAINLVIKDEAKLSMSGQFKVGIGLPEQYDVEANSILFNKRYKGLNVLRGNNIGNSLRGDLEGNNTLLSNFGNSAVNNLLSLGTVGPPPVQKSHYLRNNSVGIHANNLFNLKNSWQIKSNIQSILEDSQQDFAGMTSYITESGSYDFNENQYSKNKIWGAVLSFTASRNLEKSYLNNEFSLEYSQEDASANILSNNTHYDLRRSYQIKGFKNRMEYVPSLANGDILQWSWTTKYGTKPQNLILYPGVFATELHNNIPYDYTIQHVEVPSFYTDLNLGYRVPKGPIGQYYAINLTLDDQKMDSYLETGLEDNIKVVSQENSKNDMHWQRSAFAFHANYEYTKGKLSSRLVLPLALQYTRFMDPLFALDEEESKMLFNPSLSLKYNLSTEQELSFSYNRGNSFGNIENVYRGMIVRNYRSLSFNSAGINESRSNDYGLQYKTGKTTQLMFYSIALNYRSSLSSTMLSNTIDENTSQTELISLDNAVNSYTAQVGFDKYLFGLASTLKLTAGINILDYNQLFNADLLPFQNISYSLGPNIEAKLWRKINMSYTGNFAWSQTKQQSMEMGLNRQAFNLSQNIGIPITLVSGLHWRMSARHLYSQQQGLQPINYVFIDNFIRYTYKKWRTDFELNITNLGDIKKFEMYTISANMHAQNKYELRGRMAVLKAVFNFK